MAIMKEQRLLNVGILSCGSISQCAHLESVQKARNTIVTPPHALVQSG